MLPNGLLVALQPDPDAEHAAIVVRYDVGPKDEPPRGDGLAHLVQHLMTSESRASAPLEFANAFRQRTGGEAPTSFTLDYTELVDIVPAAHLSTALWMEADRMAYPLATATSETVARQRENVKTERARDFQADPAAFFATVARREIVGAEHPYARTRYGEPRELDALGLEDVRTFVTKHYRPNRATLIVTGAFSGPAVRTVIESCFGKIPPGPTVEPRTFPAITPPRSHALTLAAPTEESFIVAVWPVPAPFDDGYLELALAVPALRDFAEYYLRFRRGVHGRNVSFRLSPGRLGTFLVATVSVNPDMELSRALTALDDAVHEASMVGRLSEEHGVGGPKKAFVADRIMLLDHPRGRAAAVAEDLEYRGRIAPLQQLLATASAVSAPDVSNAIYQFVHARGRVAILVTADPSAPVAWSVR